MMSLRFFSKQLTRDLFLCERLWSLSKSKLFLRHQSAFLKRRTLFMNETCIVSSVSIPWQHRTHSTRRPSGKIVELLCKISRAAVCVFHNIPNRTGITRTKVSISLFFLFFGSLNPRDRSKKILEGNSPQNNRKRFFYDRMRHQNMFCFLVSWILVSDSMS